MCRRSRTSSCDLLAIPRSDYANADRFLGANPSTSEAIHLSERCARTGLRRDVESVLGFIIFLIVYLAVATVVARHSMSLSSLPGNEEKRELHFAVVFQVIIVATLIAALGHVVVLGWMRTKYSQLPLRRFLVQQSIAAVLSAAAFLRFDQSLFSTAVFAAPAVITLLVYMIGERVATNRID